MRPTLENIMRDVCFYYDFTHDEIKSRNREKIIARARQMFCFLAREFTTKSYDSIGKFIERDHASVMYAVRKFRDYMTTEERKEYFDLLKMIENPLVNKHLLMYSYMGLALTISRGFDFMAGFNKLSS